MIMPEMLVHTQELSGFIAPAVSLFIVLGMALSAKQREWALDRDGHKCQATVKHECNQDLYPLEVDHLIPQFYASMLTPPIDPDYPLNILSKCRAAHDMKHEDRVKVRREYHILKAQGIDPFKTIMRDERCEKIKNRVIYWNDSADRTDIVRAAQLTQQYLSEHPFPDKPKKRVKKESSTVSPQLAETHSQT